MWRPFSVRHGLFRRVLFLLIFLIILASCASADFLIDNDVKLTSTTNANHPSWSPDGTRIVYAANQAIWVMNSDGSGQKKLYDGMSWEGDPEFNEDGTKVYFATESKKAYSARYISIHVMDSDGSNSYKLTESSDSRAPSISPDGSRLVYTSRASGNYDMWVMDTDGTDRSRLTDAPGDESSPSWDPDGTSIVYSSMGDIFSVNVNGKGPLRLTDDPNNNIEPSYSPDGTMIAYASDIGGDYDLWIMDPTGNAHVQLTTDRYVQRAPAWSPDGKKIAYVSDRDGEYNIWVMDIRVEEIGFGIAEDIMEVQESEQSNSYAVKLKDYAASEPKKFIGIILLLSFGSVVFIVGSFMRKIS
ncbi:TolB family protein [Methanolobus sp. WCC5]|uniref:TolB family protein n=1 Tax=Methanolobus sp. WCC5 TaxID=3125785 RepID=UPI0032461A79